jgi:hypothetical protein
MNENDKNKQLENLLRKAHLPEPSSELKERITAEATKAWNQTSPELPWQTPVRRLIVSAAAAVFIIWLANSYSDYSLALWRSDRPQVSSHQPPDLDALPELSYSPLAQHLVSSSRKPSATDASALRSYAETMFLILDEAQQNGGSKTSAPAEGRSILLPKQSGFNSYS